MNVVLRQIGSIQPYPDNPRLNDDAVDAVARSIREFGFQQPIVVDIHGIIIVGHTRYKAARKLGMELVPVLVAHSLTQAQAKAYRIADNQTATIASWNESLLTQQLLDLQQLDVNLDLLGFSAEELQNLLAPPGTDGQTDPDDVPEVEEETITQPGDLWHLGRHRLLCGDATKSEDLARLVDSPADLLLTDPPYNVGYEGKTDEQLTIANDAMSDHQYRQFLVQFLRNSLQQLRPGAAFYLWHADSHGFTVRQACSEAGMEIRQCLVWVKSTFAMGRQDYHWKHEPCLYGWKDGAAHTWLSDRTQTTVLEFPKPARNAEHPTMKPVELFAYLIGNSCPVGGTVLDPFAGSGTSVIACEQSGRTARVLELDPRYCDVIVKRYEQFTGTEATRESAG